MNAEGHQTQQHEAEDRHRQGQQGAQLPEQIGRAAAAAGGEAGAPCLLVLQPRLQGGQKRQQSQQGHRQIGQEA